MESMMLIHSSRYSNICALLADDEELRTNMIELIETTESIKKEDLCGFDLNNVLNPSKQGFDIPHNAPQVNLTPDLAISLKTLQDHLNLVPQSHPFELPQVSHLGVRFAAFATQNFRDSSIIYNLPFTDGHRGVPAVIQAILAQRCSNHLGQTTIEVFLLVEEYRRIADNGMADPYTAFGFAAGYLCHQQSIGHHLIGLRHVVSHFVSTPIADTGYLHVLPMDRVRYPDFVTSRAHSFDS